MARVLLKDVNKIFDEDVHVVKDANVEVKDKEFMVLVGPSGCGKSTTLRMIAGLEDITSGEVVIGDKVVNEVPPKDRDIAMVFQNYALYPHMNVYDNMAFGLKLRKYPKKEIDKRVQEAADILGLSEFLKRKPKALSGGQRQRVAVGRAIVRHPKVFLFDEPLSNLDAKLRVQMRAEISKLHNRLEATMIYVTHDQTEAMTMGDRITVLKEGVVQQVDTPMNLYDYPDNVFVGGFIGSPAMNFIKGKLTQSNGLHFVKGDIRIPIMEKYEEPMKDYVEKDVILGIRPEHVYITQEESVRSFKAKVEVVEPMGNEIIVYLNVSGTNLLARLTTRVIPQFGDILAVKFDEDQIHFFDSQTEISILKSAIER